MVVRRSVAAAASAAVALAVFATTLVVASTLDGPGPGLAALTAKAAGPAIVDEANKPPRPSPQPALTEGDVPAAAADTLPANDEEHGPDGRPRHPSLAEAPREVILYASGCTTWRAVEPWSEGEVYAVDGLGRACTASWTPDGDVIAVELGDGADSLLMSRRNGERARLRLPGQRVHGPVANGEGEVVFCAARRIGPPALYRWTAGSSAASRWRPGCLPAIARDGALAWVTTRAFREAPQARLLIDPPGGRAPRVVAEWRASQVRSVQWTGDATRLVAIVDDLGRQERRLVSVGRDGGPPRVLTAIPLLSGEMTMQVSPAGTRVLAITTPPSGTPAVTSWDAATGRREWSIVTDGGVDATWSPSGSRLLVADRQAWTFVEPGTGNVRLRLDRLGDAPAWCCPSGVAG